MKNFRIAPLKKQESWQLTIPRADRHRRWKLIIHRRKISGSQLAGNRDLLYITQTTPSDRTGHYGTSTDTVKGATPLKKTKDSQETKILRKPVARIETTADTGLTQAQVKERMEKGWSNAPVDSPSKTTKEIIISNVFTYFNLIFLVIAVLLLLVGAFRDLTFLPVIICNTLIGIIQEIRSKKYWIS